MAIKRSRRPDPVSRSRTEEVAIAICGSLYRECHCQHAPSVCESMMSAARKAIRVASPEFAETMAKADIAAANNLLHRP
jgi:hypothetical protein